MNDELFKRINAVKGLEPGKRNESAIRNECHQILNDVLVNNTANKDKKRAKKECFSILNTLERNMILSCDSNSFKPFFKSDFALVIKNVVCAADIILCAPFISFENTQYSPFYEIFSEKLIIRAVCEAVLYFFKYYRTGVVLFKAEKHKSFSLLSIKFEGKTHFSPVIDEKTFSLLSKIAIIHDGRFLFNLSKKSPAMYLTVSSKSDSTANYKRAPSYIDLLNDKTSDLYIILNAHIK